MNASSKHERKSVEKAKPMKQARLHMGHFAFMRAVVQGLDTRQSWDRYLRIEGEHDDIRAVRKTVQWIRDEFAAAARRYSRHGIARLMQIDATRVADRSTVLPTLEEFAAEHGIEDFSQAEQLEYYRAQHGTPAGAQSRRRRVIARQLDALRWLEDLVAEPPSPSDPLSSWLHPDLSRRLEAAGIATLEDLVKRINANGYRWWSGIPGVGAGKAERICSWLASQEMQTGLRICEHARHSRGNTTPQQLQGIVRAATAVVPLEKFVAPAELNGSEGLNRAPPAACLIAADDDVSAVLAWVASKSGGSAANTRRVYLKEGERFLLWSVLARGKAMSSLTSDDCDAYLQFLDVPQPTEQWCGPRGREKWSPLWRPFEGPLSDAAKRHTVVILKNLHSFLVVNGYLQSNPWGAVPLPAAAARQPRMLSEREWVCVERYAHNLPSSPANVRLIFALRLFHETGVRIGAAVKATLADLVADGDRVSLLLPERDGQKRQAIVSASLLRLLEDHLESRGFGRNPFACEYPQAPLLGPVSASIERGSDTASPPAPYNDPAVGVAASTLYDQLRAFFTACAGHAQGLTAEERERLRAASTGWLRAAAAIQPAPKARQ